MKYKHHYNSPLGGIELKRSLLMLVQHTHNTILNTEFVTSALK